MLWRQVYISHARDDADSTKPVPIHFQGTKKNKPAVASLGGCHPGWQLRMSPLFFPETLMTFLSSPSATSAVSPLLKKTDDLICSSLSLLLISLGCHPLTGYHPTPFYLSDLVSPLFLVNLPTHFLLEGVTRGGPRSSPYWRHWNKQKERVTRTKTNEREKKSRRETVGPIHCYAPAAAHWCYNLLMIYELWYRYSFLQCLACVRACVCVFVELGALTDHPRSVGYLRTRCFCVVWRPFEQLNGGLE